VVTTIKSMLRKEDDEMEATDYGCQ